MSSNSTGVIYRYCWLYKKFFLYCCCESEMMLDVVEWKSDIVADLKLRCVR